MTARNCRPSMRFPATLSKPATRSRELRVRPNSSPLKARTTSSRFTNASRSNPVGIVCFMKTTLLTLLATALCWSVDARAADKKIVLVAGHPSHGPGEHEFNAGVQLLAKCLRGVAGLETQVCLNGYPQDEAVLRGADAHLCFADGAPGRPCLHAPATPFPHSPAEPA